MEKFIDLITLGSSHSIITSNKPSKVPVGEFVVEGESKIDHSNFGLFNITSPDLNTYYPGETAESINPDDSEFIFPVFRLLSEVVVHKLTNPIDFRANNVLRESMALLKGQTVYTEHEDLVGNHIGVVMDVFWQESYKMNGVTIPAGINAVLKLDAKSNPKIARGILQDPPAIHSSSVSVLYKWEKSHPELSDDEFYSKLATFDEKGQLIRKVANDIVLYTELSLVPHGADPFAQLLKDGKITNPHFAKKFYSLGGESFSFVDFKKAITGDPVVEISSFNALSNNNQNPKKDNSMDEFISKLSKSVNFEGGKPEELIAHIEKLMADNLTNEQAYAGEVAQLKKDKEKLTQQVTSLSEENTTLKKDETFIEVGKARLQQVRDEAVKFYSTLKGDAKDDKIISIIQNSDLETAQSFLKEYKEAVEERIPLTCQDCQSTDIKRASVSTSENQGENGTPAVKSNLQVIEERKRRKYANQK